MKPITKLLMLLSITLYETAIFDFGHIKKPASQVFAKTGDAERKRAPKRIGSFIDSNRQIHQLIQNFRRNGFLYSSFSQKDDSHPPSTAALSMKNSNRGIVIRFNNANAVTCPSCCNKDWHSCVTSIMSRCHLRSHSYLAIVIRPLYFSTTPVF